MLRGDSRRRPQPAPRREELQRLQLHAETLEAAVRADTVGGTVAGSVNPVVATVGAGISHRPPPVGLANWPLFNPLGAYATFLVPAVFILVLQQTLLVGMRTLRVAAA
jgi:ABC-2 type transport system permease protein